MSIYHPNYPQSVFAPQQQTFIAPPTSQRIIYRQPPQPYPQPQFYPTIRPQYAYNQNLPPQYLVQPAQVVRRHPQFDLNPNFDYESANFLCQAKIIQSTLFCVVCGTQYKVSEKEQHIQKHMRKTNEKSINQQVLLRVQEYHKKQTKPVYTVKPIVEPEEVDVHFDPNVYRLIQETIYENEEIEEKKEAGIGQDVSNSFNVFDNNVSLPNNNTLNLPMFDSQPNPFFSKYEHIQQHQYEIPQFQIPPPQQPKPDQPLNYNQQIIPHSLKEQPDLSHQIPQQVVQMQEPKRTNIIRAHQSQGERFEEQQPYQFVPQPVQHYGSNYNQQFSGPHQIRQPLHQEKQQSEVSISQFIRKINAQPIEVQDRRRIANQSEW